MLNIIKNNMNISTIVTTHISKRMTHSEFPLNSKCLHSNLVYQYTVLEKTQKKLLNCHQYNAWGSIMMKAAIKIEMIIHIFVTNMRADWKKRKIMWRRRIDNDYLLTWKGQGWIVPWSIYGSFYLTQLQLLGKLLTLISKRWWECESKSNSWK